MKITRIAVSRPLDRFIADGLVNPAPTPGQSRQGRRVSDGGRVSDLLAEQRR
jgi:hypothetical protein